ncbi:MAG: hypothetical protein WCP45_14480, partial [Verrucomicrobiota bacterium]
QEEARRSRTGRRARAAGAVLFADEPTGNLDSKNSSEIMKILLDLASEHGVTLVVVTHDHHLARAGDRTLVIRDGSIHPHAHVD